jgi:hypothetical protein
LRREVNKIYFPFAFFKEPSISVYHRSEVINVPIAELYRRFRGYSRLLFIQLRKIYKESSCLSPFSPVTSLKNNHNLKIMAKAAAKTSTKTQPKKTSAPRAKASTNNIEKISADALEKLQTLGIEEQLQRDLQWCLGSYRADHNPVGLYGTAKKALVVFQTEKEKKTKGITARLINDLERIVKEQPD